MSSPLTDKQDHPGSAEVGAKRPYSPLELKRLSPIAALEWLDSKSSSSELTSEQIEELKRFVKALIPEEPGGK